MKRLYFWLAVIVGLIVILGCVSFFVLWDDNSEKSGTVNDSAVVAITILENKEGIDDKEKIVNDNAMNF